ncbi:MULTISPECIES: hypothetical protein [unclassified Nonomuraea]|uniref:hypothetical protein n=1 Tax=unclassified Nonomuraea TaxID=2593643 RepID=UPI0033F865CD
MISIPPRTATDAYFTERGGSRRLDLLFDIDLGELLAGHHVVARGLEPSEGRAAHGSRYLGGVVPRSARRLSIGFEPAWGWTPPGPWCRRLDVALPDGPVTEVWTGPREAD